MAQGEIIAYKYWNQGDCAVAIVAVEGAASDVGTYIGANTNWKATTEETLQVVRSDGCKLARREAIAFLPNLVDLMSEAGLTYRD